ncbi:MAG: hypothetical protein WKG07_33895 [Hymenobacter sp.]
MLGAKEIDLRSIKVIEVEMAYKKFFLWEAPDLFHGTANRMRLVYQNPVEEFICFYLESGWQLQALERILREAKQRHAIILIMQLMLRSTCAHLLERAFVLTAKACFQ